MSEVAKPREVLLSTLQRINPFIQHGFTVNKSRVGLKKPTKDFSFEIAFSGSPRNVAGERACFKLVASVESKSLKAWRNAQPVALRAMLGPQSGFVAARAFADPESDDYYSWDLIGSKANRAVVTRLLRVINEDCLPFCDRCTDPLAFEHLELSSHIFGASFVELSLARGDRSLATEVAYRVIGQLEPAHRQALRDLLDQLTPSDFPQVTGSRSNLGFVAGVILLNDLPVVVPA